MHLFYKLILVEMEQSKTKFFFLAVAVFSLVTITCATCGYKSCNPTKPDKVNVHLIPHTHDDVGWLKTVDEYYYGANNSIQHAGIQYIIDAVISELAKDSGRRFIYVEIAYFERWWNEQDNQTRETVKQFVNDGRLEFINGGWSMNDEGCTHYNAIIDQMTLGLRFLVNTFGECAVPKVAWHIDTFGHSKEQASLISQMGFDGFFFSRLDFIDKITRLKNKTLEQVWRTNPSLGSPADLFFGATYHHYDPPDGFCYDLRCSDPPIQDDPNMFDNNVDERVNLFLEYVRGEAAVSPTNHILVTMGSDFHYEEANAWYKNLDKLIKYVNAKENKTGFHLLYSTPSCYLYNVHAANKTWTTKSEDFMPYGDGPHSFWSGYYTSRPALKEYVRDSNNILQVCRQLETFKGMGTFKSPRASPERLKGAMGVLQHHDAVTGTEKKHVADDYAKRLSIGRSDCHALIIEALSSDISKKHGLRNSQSAEHCDYANISICATTETQNSFTVMVYNPIARMVKSPIRVPVNQAAYQVMGPNNTAVSSQVQDVTASTKSVRRDRGNATKELVFMATLPPLGYTTYKVMASSSNDQFRLNTRHESNTETSHNALGQDTSINNEFLTLIFDGTTGRLKQMKDLVSNVTVQVDQSFYWYNSSAGNKESDQISGAYIFRPNRSDPYPLFDKTVQLKLVTGDVVQEVQQQFTPWLGQVIRLYKGQQAVEFSWTVGPIPIDDGNGKEIITRFDTNISSGSTFYTDSNGRQIMKRVLNQREDFPYINTEPVSANYYPINSRIYIKDDNIQFTVLTDRSEGGSSLKSGSLEVMIHRRCLHFSGSVGEPLNETGQFGDGLMVRGSHLVTLATPKKSSYLQRTLGEEIYMRPYFYVSPGSQMPVSSSFISQALPANVHLLTLEQLTPDVILLRLEHQFEKGEDTVFSKAVTVSLKDLFKPFQVTQILELSLAANQPLAKVDRLKWNIEGSATPTPQPFNFPPVSPPSFNMTLSPMDIRTFQVTIAHH